jgi:hypothetical protein
MMDLPDLAFALMVILVLATPGLTVLLARSNAFRPQFPSPADPSPSHHVTSAMIFVAAGIFVMAGVPSSSNNCAVVNLKLIRCRFRISHQKHPNDGRPNRWSE